MKVFLFLLFSFLVGLSYSQGSNKLKKQEAALKKKIANTKNLIQQTRQTEQLTMTELAIINHQIAYRESLMDNMNYQMRQLEDNLIENHKEIQQLENNLKELKEEYAKMLRYAFKNREVDYKMLYVFSAKSYTEAYHRLKYIEQYTDYKQKQVERIQQTKSLLEGKIDEIALLKDSKKELVIVQKQEKDLFLKDKENQQASLKKLQANENQLKHQLQQQKSKQ